MNETETIAQLMSAITPNIDNGLINYIRDTFPVLLATSVAVLLGVAVGLIVYIPGCKSTRDYRKNVEARLLALINSKKIV